MISQLSLLACAAAGISVLAPQSHQEAGLATVSEKPRATLSAPGGPQPGLLGPPETISASTDLNAVLADKKRRVQLLDDDIELQTKLLNDRYVTRMDALRQSVPSSKEGLKRGTAAKKAAMALIKQLEAQDLKPSHSEMKLAKQQLADAEETIIQNTVLLSGNTKALSKDSAMTAEQRKTVIERPLREAKEEKRQLDVEIAALERLDIQNGHLVQMLDQQKRLLAAEDPVSKDAVEPVEGSRSIIADDFLGARATAAALGRPLFINFTGHTAVNARKMEVTVLSSNAVRPLLATFVEAHLHSDAADAALRLDIKRRAEEIAGTSAVPIYVVIDPRSGEQLGRLDGVDFGGDRFAKFLKDALSRFETAGEPAGDEAMWRRIFILEDQVKALTARLDGASGPGDR